MIEIHKIVAEKFIKETHDRHHMINGGIIYHINNIIIYHTIYEIIYHNLWRLFILCYRLCGGDLYAIYRYL